MTQRPASQRIQPRGTESRSDQFVILLTIVVIVVAAVIVLAGVYVTRYRPPRAHVLTAGDRNFDAASIEQRVQWLLLEEPQLAPKGILELVPKTLDRFEREEVIRQRAALLVGELSAEDVDREMRAFFAPPQPTASLPEGTSLQVATATPLADDEYTRLLRQRLTRTGASKQFLENLVRAQVLEKRLKDHFKKDLPKTASQVHFALARVTDNPKAEQIHEIAVRPGVDFNSLASTNSVSGAGPIADLGWVLSDELSDAVRNALKDLKPGDVSAVASNQQYFEVYKLIEADAAREVNANQQDTLADKKIDAWLDEQRNALRVSRDLSSSEDAWIRKEAVAAYVKANRQPSVPR